MEDELISLQEKLPHLFISSEDDCVESEPKETVPPTGIEEFDAVIKLVDHELLGLEHFNLA